MNRNTLYSFLIAILVVIGCSKDSDPGSNPTDTVDKSANLLGTGDSANDILSNDVYSRMVIELAYVDGFRPTQASMTNFVNFLRDRTFKQEIEIVYNNLPSPNKNTLTIQEIADLENENRTLYNEDDTIAIYIYFTDAVPVEDVDNQTVTLGAVYRNTSMVVYEENVRFIANQSSEITTTDVETSTVNHEFGHLLGLVDLGTPEVNPHTDPDAESHCNVLGCLMGAELQFGDGMMSAIKSSKAKGVSVPVLDAECILDLQANGGR